LEIELPNIPDGITPLFMTHPDDSIETKVENKTFLISGLIGGGCFRVGI